MMRKWFILSLLLLAGCNTPQEKKSHTLRMAVTSDIETFDPREARSLAAVATCKMLYDGLMRIDEQGKPIPSLAQVISISPDQRTYTVTLQVSVWTDGEPVTAYDFEKGWKSLLDPKNGFECASELYCLENGQAAHRGEVGLEAVGVRALNGQTLIIRLEQPIPYFLERLASPVFSPIPSHALNGDVDWSNKGKLVNGPFVIDKNRLQDQLVLVKNQTYWDADVVALDGITLKVTPDGTTATLLFQQGELDWIGSPLAELPPDYAQEAYVKGELTTAPVAATLWYKFNTTRPPLDNPKVRRALSLAINRQEIVDHVLKQGQNPTLSPLPPALSVGQANQKLPEASEVLQQALDEMGLTKEELPPITLTYSNNAKVSKLTQALQQQWKQALGLNVELESTEFKTLLSRMGRMDYQMGGAKIWISDYQDPSDILNLYIDKEEAGQGGLNETGWEDAEYKKLMERARFEIDLEKRRALFASAEAIFMEQMPILPICDHTYAYQKRGFTGERIPPAGCPDFKWVRLE